MSIEIISPHGAFGADAFGSLLDVLLRDLAEKASTEDGEWSEKYGTNIENDVFMMHRFCWCESDDCPWCWDEEKYGRQQPNFHHKPTGFKVWWYKYIGRGVILENQDKADLHAIFKQCRDSLTTQKPDEMR